MPELARECGRPFVKQLASKSGIWFWDALPEWFSPQDIEEKLAQDLDADQRGLDVVGAKAGSNSGRPRSGQDLGLLQYCQRCLLLLVRRVSIFTQDAFDKHPQLGAHVLAQRPINRDIVADDCDQLPGDDAECPRLREP
jgi:hypothetical protein